MTHYHGMAGLAVAICILFAAGASADTVTWSFTGNSTEASSSLDLTGATMADNEHANTPDKSDAGIGEGSPSNETCDTTQCDDEQACLCDQKAGPSPNLDHFLEFAVACRDGLWVDPSELRFLAEATANNRPGDIYFFVNTTDGFAAYSELTDSPQAVTSTGFSLFDVDLNELPPAPYYSFRMHPGHPDPGGSGLDFRARVDDVVVDGECVEGGGNGGEGKLATGVKRVTSYARTSKCTYANVSHDDSVLVDVFLRDQHGNDVAVETDVSLAPGETGMIMNNLFGAREGKRYCVLKAAAGVEDLTLEILIEDFSGNVQDSGPGQ